MSTALLDTAIDFEVELDNSHVVDGYAMAGMIADARIAASIPMGAGSTCMNYETSRDFAAIVLMHHVLTEAGIEVGDLGHVGISWRDREGSTILTDLANEAIEMTYTGQLVNGEWTGEVYDAAVGRY